MPSESKSILGCLTTELVSSNAVSRNCNLEDTHDKYIKFAGDSGEGMFVESTEIRIEVHNTGFKFTALNIFPLMPHLDELQYRPFIT